MPPASLSNPGKPGNARRWAVNQPLGEQGSAPVQSLVAQIDCLEFLASSPSLTIIECMTHEGSRCSAISYILTCV